MPSSSSAAVQHERKPIVDRKDGIGSGGTGSVSGSSSSAGGPTSVSSAGKSSYQQVRVKQQQQQHASAAAAVAASAASLFQHAATPTVGNTPTTPFGLSETLFPMNLNFAELTQTLSKTNYTNACQSDSNKQPFRFQCSPRSNSSSSSRQPAAMQTVTVTHQSWPSQSWRRMTMTRWTTAAPCAFSCWQTAPATIIHSI